eukprot:6518244-Alexandrium_andersonii.AAC.1
MTKIEEDPIYSWAGGQGAELKKCYAKLQAWGDQEFHPVFLASRDCSHLMKSLGDHAFNDKIQIF